MLLCPSSISTAQRSLPKKACFSAPLSSAPRSGASPEKHASLSLFHQHRAAEAPQKSAHAPLSAHFHQHRAAEASQKSMLLYPASISPAQRRLPIEKHTSLLLFHQNRAAEAPQKSIHLYSSSISPAQRKLPRKAPFPPPRTHAASWELPLPGEVIITSP